ncbi:SRPBCC domain-containing protein [Pseudonocardia sp.]|uniref:SRPBCC domain-containing protein n=1 Tax=Pseudonocardia sp. TaxID=60912 RepID=UPI00260B5658|nr:SRPBCC domain-containing protein [Pseudonocardia sp.]
MSRTIDAPPDAVWDLLTDAATYRDWNPAVIDIQGPIALGSTVRLVSVAAPKRTFSVTVAEMTAPNRMVWSDGMPLGLFRGNRTYLLEPDGDATRFTMTEEFSGALSGLICRSIPDLTPSFVQFADGLKTAAEARAQRSS